MMCDKCNVPMVKLSRYVDMDEPEYELSEGQMADFLAAQESGDTSEWDYGVIDYECKICGARISELNDNVKSYDGLIHMWHEKAKQGDFFSRFVFEYIAFNAYLKSRIIVEVVGDRTAIQRLKRDKKLRDQYLGVVKSHKHLVAAWEEVIKELKREPLLNSSRDIDNPGLDRYWNYTEDKLTPEGIANKPKSEEGVIHSAKDWTNMVEFWYSVRNNLFHGGKSPDVPRDHFLVKHAFFTLSVFMKIQMSDFGEDLKIY